MRIRWSILLLLGLSLSAQAEIFKVVGPDGKISYTDKKPQDTTGSKTETLSIQTYGGVPTTSAASGYSKKVTILSAEWCGVCQRAKAYMKANRIPFTEWDVDKSEVARNKMRDLKASGVPVILAGNQKMVGFSPAAFEDLLDRAGIERR